jgi:hypothetical protein
MSPFADGEYMINAVFNTKNGVQNGNHNHGAEEDQAKVEPHSVRDDIVIVGSVLFFFFFLSS